MASTFNDPFINIHDPVNNKKLILNNEFISSYASSSSISTGLNNLEIKDSNYLALSRLNVGTPKRRLSYTNSHNSPTNKIINNNKINNDQVLKIEASDEILHLNNDRTDLSSSTTPFIKRKCLNKDQSIRLTQLSQRSSLAAASRINSPYSISSTNLENTGSNSPRLLNDSFETLQLETCDSGSKIKKYRLNYRRSTHGNFFKHKSAPIKNLSPQSQFIINTTTDARASNESYALNDISNHINKQTNFLNLHTFEDTKQVAFKLNDNAEAINFDEKSEDVSELENFFFGDNNNNNNNKNLEEQQERALNKTCKSNITTDHENQSQLLIKQSLEIDAKFDNLIGDRTKEHILPTIISQKHQDLNCISPETLVDVLNGFYDNQIRECIIIDSRYPYEYNGGHISTALNIFTQEKLGEEMFIKRLNIKSSSKYKVNSSISSSILGVVKSLNNDYNSNNSSLLVHSNTTSENCLKNENANIQFNNPLHKLKSNSQNNSKRTIVIFHCEFSSERGPNLLRFLRNLDRNLNESVYPSLYYPELYLLEGGYKSFYENFKNYCDPQQYKPMLHAEHSEEMKHFRAKAKSWEVSRHNILFKCTEHLQKNLKMNNMPQSDPDKIQNSIINQINEENVSVRNHRVIRMKNSFTNL